MPTLTDPVVPNGRMRALGQPTLETGELVIRPWRAGDAGAVLAAYQDPDIQHWHVHSMSDLAEASAWISPWPGRWQEETRADWAVTKQGEVVGRVGIKGLDLWEGQGEIAYWVMPAARGNRVAPRAVSALTHWAFEVLGLHRLQIRHSVRNIPSCRVAEQVGFPSEATLRSQGQHADGWHDMHLHARVAD